MQDKINALRNARDKERRRFGRFFGAALVFLVVFLVVAGVYIGTHSGGALPQAETDGTESTDSSEPVPEVSGVTNLLLLCTNTEKTDLRFLTVIQINFDDNTYTVCSFSPREAVKADGRFAGFDEHYQMGGIKQLVRAVEAISGIKIDRYIASHDNSFKRAINSMGAVVLSFPEQINYRCEDFAIVLLKGEQKMRGDDLLKYMRYCAALGDEGLQMQSEAIGACFKQYITEKTISKKDNLYATLINTLQSDISVMDFKKASDKLVYMQRTDFDVQCIRYFRIIAD